MFEIVEILSEIACMLKLLPLKVSRCKTFFRIINFELEKLHSFALKKKSSWQDRLFLSVVIMMTNRFFVIEVNKKINQEPQINSNTETFLWVAVYFARKVCFTLCSHNVLKDFALPNTMHQLLWCKFYSNECSYKQSKLLSKS